QFPPRAPPTTATPPLSTLSLHDALPISFVTHDGQLAAKQMPFLSDAVIIAAKNAMGEDDDKDVAADAASGTDFGAAGSGSTPGSLGCAGRDKGKGNKRVNQDCTFRRQAEEVISFNPANPVQ